MPSISETVITQRLQGLIDLSKKLGGLNHTGVLGLLREALIESFLVPLLVEPYRAASGVIIDTNGRQSGQCDIIVWDNSIIPPLYHARSAGLFGIESVVATIEIKSTLTRDGVRQAFEMGDATKNMNYMQGNPRPQPPNPQPMHAAGTAIMPLNIIFGFASDNVVTEESDRVRDVAANDRGGVPAHQYVNAVIVPGRRSTILDIVDRHFNPTADLAEVRLPMAGLLNSLHTISEHRGQPRVGAYLS
jgi:hypothetical protein